MSRYVFDNSADQAKGRFFALESCYDPFSRRQVELTGIARGWRCLEVGGGGGSLGDWLGEQVGPDGEVTITDLDLRWAESRPRPPHVRLMRHDIVQDPLPADGYDLVHARLVLQHLPERLATSWRGSPGRCGRAAGWCWRSSTPPGSRCWPPPTRRRPASSNASTPP
ncbi:class I SAM-dependent methyltransferase [Streptomyces sp. GLT-R25]